jgi:glutathione peroxidase-family protein
LRDYSALNGGDIRGNYTKFLVNANGDVVAYYLPSVRDTNLVRDIDRLLEVDLREDYWSQNVFKY